MIFYHYSRDFENDQRSRKALKTHKEIAKSMKEEESSVVDDVQLPSLISDIRNLMLLCVIRRTDELTIHGQGLIELPPLTIN